MSTTSHSGEAQLQSTDDSLYFVTKHDTFRLHTQDSFLKTALRSLVTETPKELIGGEFKRKDSIKKLSSLLIEDSCSMTIEKAESSYGEGFLICRFFGKTKKLEFKLNHKSISKHDRPYIGYENYQSNDSYFLGISVGEDLYSHSIAYATFTINSEPTLVKSPLDCDRGMSDIIYSKGTQTLCFDFTKFFWKHYRNNISLSFPSPCAEPTQLVVHRNKLWGIQNDSLDQYHICRYNTSLKLVDRHSLYRIDIEKTMRSTGLPLLEVDNITSRHQEFDNGRLISYKFNLKESAQIDNYTSGGPLNKKQLPISIPHGIKFEYENSVGGSHKRLISIDIPENRVLFKMETDTE